MKYGWMVVVLALAALGMGKQQTGSPRFDAGARVADIRRILGQPTIEFPLKGQLILDYGDCVFTCTNGIVMSARYKTPAEPVEAKPAVRLEPGLEKLRTQAAQGDLEAQYRLAYACQTGEGLAKDVDEAIRWYTRAALHGHVAAQHNLGVLYTNRDGGRQDLAQAYAWALVAARAGNRSLLEALEPCLIDEEERTGRLRAEVLLAEIDAIHAPVIDTFTVPAKPQDGEAQVAANKEADGSGDGEGGEPFATRISQQSLRY